MIVPARRSVPFPSFDGIFNLGDPLTVVRLVIFHVIGSSKRIFRPWFSSYVGQKISKASLPTSTHADAFGTIPFVLRATRIVAALFHRFPSEIFRHVAVPSSLVNVEALAATALAVAMIQLPRFYFSFFTARTPAEPQSALAVLPRNLLPYCPKAELLARKIDQCLTSRASIAFAMAESPRRNFSFFATRASAQPCRSRSTAIRTCLFKDCPRAEAFAGNINQLLSHIA